MYECWERIVTVDFKYQQTDFKLGFRLRVRRTGQHNRPWSVLVAYPNSEREFQSARYWTFEDAVNGLRRAWRTRLRIERDRRREGSTW